MKSFSATSFFSPLLLTLLSFVLIFSSCATAEDDGVDPNIEENDRVTVSFALEGEGGVPVTYAIDGDPERNVSELDILLFDLYGNLAYAPVKGTISAMDPTTGKSRVTATVMRAHYGNIIILANARGMVNAALNLSTPLAVGMPQDEAMKLFHLTLPGKWNTDTSSGGYVGIPMYGETGYVNVNLVGDNIFNTTLLRMLTRVDVAVTEAVQPHFKLKSIRVYNRNSVGMLAKSATVGEPNLPAEPQKIADPLTYDGAEITKDTISRGEIYLFESAIVNTLDDTKRLHEATCLVVGGFYSADGITMGTTELFYRVDFAQMDANNIKHFYDIIRNHQYNISIVSVTGPGLEDPDDALNTELSRIDVVVVDWANGGEIGSDIDGSDILRVDPGSLTLTYLERATTSLDNKASVSSTHTSGWCISKITELVGGVENDISTGGWLSTDLALNAIQTEDYTFSAILSQNEEATRVGYIYINSGPRMSYRMKVTQRAAVRLTNIVWDDYDGVGDLDAGLTSITIEQSGTIVPTLTSAIAKGITTPLLAVEGTITKITLTYKGYELDVPDANYSVDPLSKTLTVIDRTLIGKAVHMNKIRDDLAGSYIQVSDVDLATYPNWEPIGASTSVDTQFTGNYDGGGDTRYKITNLKINKATDGIGLFGYATGSYFKNIHIASGSINGKNHVGAICGYAADYTTISNCSNNAPITTTAGSAGGICGYNSGKVINCHNLVSGSVNGPDRPSNLGGICGENSGSGSIDGCTNAAIIYKDAQGGRNIGGICGSSSLTTLSEIINCDNLAGASVYGNSYVGGICGYAGGTIDNCTNSATVNKKGGATGGTSIRIGGICGGIIDNTRISNCKNLKNANVSGNTRVGGICGEVSSATIEDCTNAATITGATNSSSSHVAGICGVNYSGSIIIRCYNLPGGNVSEGGNQTGGVFGANHGTVELCTNEANVSGATAVGGIGGYNSTNNTKVINCKNLTEGIIISGSSMIGGVCGYSGGIISGCENNSTVTGTSSVGGICGSNTDTDTGGTILNCKNLEGGKVIGQNQGTDGTGGIVGVNKLGVVSGCLNVATVKGHENVGGICGNNTASLYACINTGTASVSGVHYVGGICGRVSTGGAVSASYNTGSVTKTDAGLHVGAVIGGGLVPERCYFGGNAAALGFSSSPGSTKFGPKEENRWPNEGITGWELATTGGPWKSLGAWNGGSPTYPTLAP